MTENAPHTPRPFVYHPGGYGRYHPEDDGQYHGFLSVPESNTTVTVYADTLDELNAVCSLIAAAPDLLAALQQMRRQFDTYRRTHEQAAACAAADAAIARALTGDKRDTGNSQDAPTPAPGTDATTADGRFISGSGYGGERM